MTDGQASCGGKHRDIAILLHPIGDISLPSLHNHHRVPGYRSGDHRRRVFPHTTRPAYSLQGACLIVAEHDVSPALQMDAGEAAMAGEAGSPWGDASPCFTRPRRDIFPLTSPAVVTRPAQSHCSAYAKTTTKAPENKTTVTRSLAVSMRQPLSYCEGA